MNTILRVETTKEGSRLSTSVKQKGLIGDIVLAAGDSIALIVEALAKDDNEWNRSSEDFLKAINEQVIRKLNESK